jgi:hypothetical protein
VIWTPKGSLVGEEFTAPFILGVDFYLKNISKYPNLTWLNDTRKLGVVRPSDVHWLDKNVNDKLFTAGASKVAFVLSEDIMGRFGTQMYTTFTNMRSDNKFQIKDFETMEEAITWLKEPLKKDK